jgi:hypothetical protein
MKIKKFADSGALVELSSGEIVAINNALNEVCNGIGLGDEFETRIGCTTEEAKRLLLEVSRLSNSIGISN